MNYLTIVLDGYCNLTDRKYLKEYFIRESKKAEAEFYTPEVFLTGCKTAVQTYLIGDLYRQKQESERELFDAKQWAKENEPDTINQRFEQEDNLNIEDYLVNLWQVTNGRYTGQMDYFEIMHISDTLDLLISVDALIDAVKNIQPTDTGTTTEPPAGTTLHTDLEPTRLDVLYSYLTDEKLIKTTPEMWRYWFTKPSLQAGKQPKKIQWLGAGSVLSNVIMLVCGNFTNHTKTAIEAAFKLQSGTNYQRPTQNRNNRGKYPYKRIYEIMEHAETKLQS